MKQHDTRRHFLKTSLLAGSAAFLPFSTWAADQTDVGFDLIDYHVHLSPNFSIEDAIALSNKRKVKFGIVEHPGPQYAIKNDDDLKAYINKLKKHPVFVGLQPMKINWTGGFSKKLLDRLDYILMDADTIPLEDGKHLSIWRHNNYIDDLDAFMEMYMEHIVYILKNEPITIFARPTYLPVNFGRYYDQVWTTERMDTIIDLAKQRNIALEISTPMHVPNKKFILRAKDRGVKFTFGTNARNEDAGKFHYGIKMIKECKLTEQDFLQLD